MFMVVFKCTRSERDCREIGYSPDPEPLDCYMVSNKMFDTLVDAKQYAKAMPLARQARITDVLEFRCPRTGEWLEGPAGQDIRQAREACNRWAEHYDRLQAKLDRAEQKLRDVTEECWGWVDEVKPRVTLESEDE